MTHAPAAAARSRSEGCWGDGCQVDCRVPSRQINAPTRAAATHSQGWRLAAHCCSHVFDRQLPRRCARAACTPKVLAVRRTCVTMWHSEHCTLCAPRGYDSSTRQPLQTICDWSGLSPATHTTAVWSSRCAQCRQLSCCCSCCCYCCLLVRILQAPCTIFSPGTCCVCWVPYCRQAASHHWARTLGLWHLRQVPAPRTPDLARSLLQSQQKQPANKQQLSAAGSGSTAAAVACMHV